MNNINVWNDGDYNMKTKAHFSSNSPMALLYKGYDQWTNLSLTLAGLSKAGLVSNMNAGIPVSSSSGAE